MCRKARHAIATNDNTPRRVTMGERKSLQVHDEHSDSEQRPTASPNEEMNCVVFQFSRQMQHSSSLCEQVEDPLRHFTQKRPLNKQMLPS